MRDLVYISYSHKDKEWHDRLREILDRDERIKLWDNTKPLPGSKFMHEIAKNVARAKTMVMLVSNDYLAPDCDAADCEFKPALESAKRGELTIVWIPVRKSAYHESPLAGIMAALNPTHPLELMGPEEWPPALEGVYHQILRILGLDPRGFDVFLSHNTKDKPAVRQLAQALRARGLKVWLDEWELPPGIPWQEKVEEIIKSTRSSAVLVGRDGLGPWERPEMRACLDQYVKRELPVIPVLLPDAPKEPELPLFLRSFAWVDLRGGVNKEGLDRLVWGITGVKAGQSPLLSKAQASQVLEASTTKADHRPTRLPTGAPLGGFFAYDENWVGRKTLVDELSRRLEGSYRVLMLVGITGIGKTALAERLALESKDWLREDWTRVLRENFEDQDNSGFASVAARWLQQCGQSVTAENLRHPQRLLDRLTELLCEHRYLVLMDSLESVLQGNEADGWGDFADAWWVKFFQGLLTAAFCQSRAILTSQDLPAQLERIGTRFRNFWYCQPLGGLTEEERLALFMKAGLDVREESPGRSYQRESGLYTRDTL